MLLVEHDLGADGDSRDQLGPTLAYQCFVAEPIRARDEDQSSFVELTFDDDGQTRLAIQHGPARVKRVEIDDGITRDGGRFGWLLFGFCECKSNAPLLDLDIHVRLERLQNGPKGEHNSGPTTR